MINHHEWLKVWVKIHLEKGTERMEEENYHLVWMTFRELWAKGANNNIL